MALQDKKIMPSPWLAHREIERYSIGWRMGYGEDYIDRFGDWLDTLSPEERTEYRTLFPEPVTWDGWQDDTSKMKSSEGVAFYPFLWAEAESLESRVRKVVPMDEILRLQFAFLGQDDQDE